MMPTHEQVTLDLRTRKIEGPSPRNAKRDDMGVLVIYTGGTIGCKLSDPADPLSPMNVADWEYFSKAVHELELLQEKFRIDAEIFEKPIDSTNMKPGYWSKIVQIIRDNYSKYNGFVILHGTDTMVYTAAALSFMLVNLAKPVILTGSQLPVIDRPRSDGIQNLITSIMIANGPYYKLPVVPEVCIFFRDKLLRGNRARKISASGYQGFDSLNYPPLGEAGEHIDIHEGLLRKHEDLPDFTTREKLNTNVINFSIFPGVQDGELLRQFVHLEKLAGLVLQTYGTGNAPTDGGFLDIVGDAAKKISVLNVTQCVEGAVEQGTYETSVSLLERGVLSAADITPEAAMCKLMVLLGDDDLQVVPSRIGELIQQNMAGEQSLSILEERYVLKQHLLNSTENRIRVAGKPIAPMRPAVDQISKILLRLRGAELSISDDPGYITIGVYLGLKDGDSLDGRESNCVDHFKRRKNQISKTLIFDITEVAKRVWKPGSVLPITFTFDGKDGDQLTWQGTEVILHLTNWECIV